MASPPLTSFLINSNVELGVLVFIFSSVLRAGSPSLLPSSSYASGRTGEEILWCSTQLRSFLKNLSQSHAHSVALCCSCFPGGLLVPRLARRAPESLGFPFFHLFFRTSALSGRGTPLVGRKVFGRRQGRDRCLSSGCVLRSGQCAEAGEGVRASNKQRHRHVLP